MEKCIFHVDVNSAFLSWSAVKKLKEDPDTLDLRTVPSAVAGDVSTRHGIITARSIPARKYGVKTGEPVVKALQKCPNLILTASDFPVYREYSRAFIRILQKYSAVLEQVSIDEAFLDMTEAVNFSKCKNEKEAAFQAAEKLKNEIRSSLGFTVNVGISVNKLLAKMASDFEKPDRIHTLYPQEVEEKMWPLPVSSLYGCGQATAARLRNMGINTIGDAAHTDIRILRASLGDKAGSYIYESANGIGSTVVHADQEEAKGYSNESTTVYDITQENYESEGKKILEHLAAHVSSRLQADHVYASTIGICVKTDGFQRKSRQMTLPESTNRYEDINLITQNLMRQLVFGEKGLFAQEIHIRLIGVSATNLDHGGYRQISLFDMEPDQWKAADGTDGMDGLKEKEKQKKLDAMMTKIKKQFGDKAVQKGIQ